MYVAARARAHVANVDQLLQSSPPDHIIQYPINNTIKVRAPQLGRPDNDAPLLKAVVRLEKNDTLGTAKQLLDIHPNSKVAVLNMANNQNPGGGFLAGGRAQEEDLCHCSNLYNVLIANQHLYPLQRRQILFSPRVTVMKQKVGHGHRDLPHNSWFWVDVISCAGIAQPFLLTNSNGEQGYQFDNDRQLMRDKISWVVNEAIAHHCDRLVLAPLGCGVFRNPPQEVATMMKEHLISRDTANRPHANWARYGLKEIVIGIFDPSGNVWSAFMDVFKEGHGLHSGVNALPEPEHIQYTTFPPRYVAAN